MRVRVDGRIILDGETYCEGEVFYLTSTQAMLTHGVEYDRMDNPREPEDMAALLKDLAKHTDKMDEDEYGWYIWATSHKVVPDHVLKAVCFMWEHWCGE